MKICAYEVRSDEAGIMDGLAQQMGVEVAMHSEVPSMENISMVEGCEGVTMLGQGSINAALLSEWKKRGVGYISTRTVGYNHIDVKAAKELGICVCNASYPPTGVAEYTIMMMLLCLRHYKQVLWRIQVNDYSLAGLEGKEIGSLTVGVIGTGRIGRTVIRILKGFGCRILAYDVYPNEEVKKDAEYVSLDELYAQSDMITLHIPLFDETFHMIDDESIAKMKDGVVIVNCARGELADPAALIRGIESGKIGELGLDTMESEAGIVHVNHKTDIISNPQMAYLRQFKNVVMTPHMAFYTDLATKDMVRCGLEGIKEMKETGTYRNQI